jgi:hypothetical protein
VGIEVLHTRLPIEIAEMVPDMSRCHGGVLHSARGGLRSTGGLRGSDGVRTPFGLLPGGRGRLRGSGSGG